MFAVAGFHAVVCDSSIVRIDDKELNNLRKNYRFEKIMFFNGKILVII